jgi:hypothetical protein
MPPDSIEAEREGSAGAEFSRVLAELNTRQLGLIPESQTPAPLSGPDPLETQIQ